jgi:hypothetical protein
LAQDAADTLAVFMFVVLLLVSFTVENHSIFFLFSLFTRVKRNIMHLSLSERITIIIIKGGGGGSS